MKILFKLLMISILFTSLSPADYIQGWKIISIRQPVLADPNSTFNVPITVVLNIICQRAPKVYHLGAVESVPPVNTKNSRFSQIISGGSAHGEQDKNGTQRTHVFTFQARLV